MSIAKIADYPLPARSSYPANTTRWRPDAARAVLLIHDAQRYFLDFYAEDSRLIREILGNLAHLLAWARSAGVPVVYTAQPHSQSAQERGLLTDMWGPGLQAAAPDRQRIVDALAPEPGDTVLTKWRYSAFQRSDLRERMRLWNRDQLIIGGVYAHIGCLATAIEAFMSDIQPFMVADAVADFSEADHRMALSYVAQRCGCVVETADLAPPEPASPDLEAWLRDRLLDVLDDCTELDPDESLIVYGLDSLQIMRISAELKARGFSPSYEALARAPTLSGWLRLLQTGPGAP